MNTAIEQITPETLARIETQARSLGLSIDEYLRRLLPGHEKELALRADITARGPERSDADKELRRQSSISWIRSHREEYGGLYVALDGDLLVGTGETYGEALKAARQKGCDDAFIGDVLPPDYEGFLGGWD